MNKNNCPICEKGMKPDSFMYIPLYDENKIRIDKVLKVKVGGELHKFITKQYGTKI